jgi:rSAM/selenodomain-associated transferase 1
MNLRTHTGKPGVAVKSTKIIIFAKAPQPGWAKTRLIPALGAEGAAELALRMLRVTLAAARQAAIGPVELCVTPEIADRAWQNVTFTHTLEINSQGSGDLGARLARATARALEHHNSVLLIGTDCPLLNAPALRAAAAKLRRADAVIYPTVDGGFALLGLRQSDVSVFSDIAWSTNEVTSEVMKRINALQWSVHVGPTLYDIDEPADLQRLPPEWRFPRTCISQ